MSGSGGDVGYDYQADGTAFVAAHGLSGQPLGWFEDFTDVPSEWSAETGGPGDDLRVITRDGHVIEVQAKHALKRGEDYLKTFRRLVSGLKNDHELRGILLVDRHASANIRDDLKQDILRIGTGRTDHLKEITLDLLQDLVETPDTVSDVLARLKIIVVDLDEGADGVRLACALLGRVVPPDKATVAFEWLGKRYHRLIKRRSRDTVSNCLSALRTQLGLVNVTSLTYGTRPNVVTSVLESQLENISAHLAQETEIELQTSRSAWRSGRKSDAAASIARLRAPTRWQAYPDELRAKILRFQALLILDAGDVPASRSFADEAERIAPGANNRLRALLARAEGNFTTAFAELADANDSESITLRSALLLESGKIEEALAALRDLPTDAEACRLRAFAHTIQHDMVAARLEIEKASQLEPSWHAIIQSKMIIEYLSGLSPAALPPGIPAWAEPVEWAFVKTGDHCGEHFQAAVNAATRLLREGEPGPEERRNLEAWKLASIANDPQEVVAASAFAKEALARDPSNHLIIAWASARRLEIDLTAPVNLLRERVLAGDGSIHEAIILLEHDMVQGSFELAVRVLEATEHLFSTSGNSHLWRLFRAQITAKRPELAPGVLAPADLDLSAIGARLAHLQTQALLTGDWNALISELRTLTDRGDGRSAFELCKLLAGQRKWADAAQYSRLLPEKIQTAESVRLAAVILFNAGQASECLALLDAHRSWFHNSRLDPELQHLRIAAARTLGLIPTAAADAEEIFAREQSRSNFLLLAQLYFEKGDFVSLAAVSRNNYAKVDLSSEDLIRLAVWLSHEDPRIAADMWRQAMSLGVADAEVTMALDAAYKLGLDSETRPLIERLSQLPSDQVRRLSLQEVQAFFLERRSSLERAYDLYRQGDVPAHLFAQAMKRPLSWWYHRALLENERAGSSVAGPTFARHGSRAAISITRDTGPKPHLHADLTALLTAGHLEFLPDIEKCFCPIRIPQRTLVALAAMRDRTAAVQPARQSSRKFAKELVRQERISIVEFAVPSATTLWESREAELMHCVKEGWVLVDYPSSLDTATATEPENKAELAGVMRSPHCVLDSLVELAEISDKEAAHATEHLGHELRFENEHIIPRGSTIVIGWACLETLAGSGLLLPATRVFHVLVSKSDWVSVESEIAAFETAEEDAKWVSDLIHHLNRGLESGSYELIPSPSDPQPTEDGEAHHDQSLETNCLNDLFRFRPAEADIIWVDDRWMTGFAHRDGAAIIGTPDVLYTMRHLGAISDGDLFRGLQRLRDADFRFLTFSPEELTYHVLRAGVTQQGFNETRELRTLRRYYSRCVSDGAVLRITPNAQRAAVEWQFLLQPAASAMDVLFELAVRNEPRDVTFARMEWVLDAFYAPDKGRAFTTADRDPQLDLRMEAMTIAGLLARHATVSFKDESRRRARRQYLEWIYLRLIRRRFDVDPLLRVSTLDIFKNIVTQSFKGLTSEAYQPYVAAFIAALVEDMPEELRELVSQDSEFVKSMGVSTYPALRFGNEGVPAAAFWNAVTESIQTRNQSTFDIGADTWSVSIQTEGGIDRVAAHKGGGSTRYVLSEPVEIMSDSVATRERGMRSISQSFDLPRAEEEAVIARVSLIPTLSERMEELARLRRESTVTQYEELNAKLRLQQPVVDADFLDFQAEFLLRHLRISGKSPEKVETLLNNAASTLLEEVGLAETIQRMVGIPRPLPQPVLAKVESITVDERRSLFTLLLKSIGRSPMASAHVANLMSKFRTESPAYSRLASRVASGLVHRYEGALAAWIRILRYVVQSFMFLDNFRALTPELRLIVSWSHADRLYRTLTTTGVEDQTIMERFGSRPGKLPAEMIFGRDEFAEDAAHPESLEVFPAGLALACYALKDVTDLNESLKSSITVLLTSDPSKIVPLLAASRPRVNALNSVFTTTWLALLPDALQTELAYDAIQSRCREILLGFVSGASKIEEFAFIHAVLGDGPFAAQFQELMRDAILAMQCDDLLTPSESIRFAVLVSIAHLGGSLRGEASAHIRTLLLQLCKVLRESAIAAGEKEDMLQVVLSAAFELYRSGRPIEENYSQLASLLSEMVSQWPQFAEQCQVLVDALAQGLPNVHSRLFWKLQIMLRAVR